MRTPPAYTDVPERSGTASARTNLVALDVEHMASLVARLGWPAYRTRQILQWIYQHRIREIAGMSNLSLVDRETLGRKAVLERLASPRFSKARMGPRNSCFP